MIDPEDLTIVPIERSETIPSSWYTHPEMHAVDDRSIFSTTWQNVGHVSQLPSPGDYLLGRVGHESVLVIRGKDAIIRAFYNVCRHRGGPLAIEERGNCNILQCKYHGWTYLLDGSLRGTPKFDRTELFDEKEFGLVPIPLEQWEGLLFVRLEGEAGDGRASAAGGVTPKKLYDGIAARIAPHALSPKKFARRVEYDVRCNWKVYVDNYLEGYHLPFVHPELCNLLDYQKYVTETYEYYSLQYSPFTGKDNVYTTGSGEAYYYFLFPNFMLNILPGRLQTNVVVPVAHNRCRVLFDYYYDDVSSPAAAKAIQADLDYNDMVQKEDIEICELVQRGLESRSYDRGRFSVEMEQGVYHFQCLLKKAYM